MQNPMQIIQLLSQIKNSGNPTMAMQTMFGNNPAYNRAVEMSKGKTPQELQQTIKNLARERGIDETQLHQMASMFGIKL